MRFPLTLPKATGPGGGGCPCHDDSGDDGGDAANQACGDVERRPDRVTMLEKADRFVAEGRERGVAAEEAGRDEQSDRRFDGEAFSRQGQEETEHEVAA